MADADDSTSPAAEPDPATDSGAVPAAAAESGSAKRKGRSKRKHTVMKVIAASAVVLALITGLTVIYAYRHLNDNLITANYDDVFVEPRPAEEEVSGPQQPIDILIMGSDSREGENNIDGLTEQGDRSDTTILLHLSADRTRAYGVSIPRDTLVTRPDCKDPDTGETVPGGTEQQWNAAFNLAGPGCTISQFEQISGIRVEHSVVVDFSGFQDMVDAVGGVSVCIPETIDDREHGIYLEEGTRKITGKEALSYVRVRQGNTVDGEEAIDGSDPGRIKRQQAFVASMARQVVSAGTLANPYRLYRFLDAATKSLELSDIESLRDIAGLGSQFRGIGLDKIQFVTIPFEYTEDFLRVRMLPEADDVWARLDADEPLTRAQVSGSITAANAPGATETPAPSPDPSESPSESPSETPSPSDDPTTTAPSPTTSPTDDEAQARREVGLCV